MPTYKLPCGRVLTGPAAQAEIDKQRKAEKEAAKAAKTKKVEALKSGDAMAVAAAESDLASVRAAGGGGLSTAEAFQASVLDEIRSGKHSYSFFRVCRAADWEEDVEEISSYQLVNLGFCDASDGVSKQAPGEKEINLFLSAPCNTQEKLRAAFERAHYGDADFESFVSKVMKRRMLEAHPSLLKKSGKMAIDIPEGAYVAVKNVQNTAQRLAPKGGNGHRIMALQDVSITHNYICAVIPPEMKDICFA